jgi:hypothetical protein
MLVQIEILGFSDSEMHTLMGDFALVSETQESDTSQGDTEPPILREIPIIKDM